MSAPGRPAPVALRGATALASALVLCVTAGPAAAHGPRPVLLVRPDGSAVTVGPASGCFTVAGPVRSVSVPFGHGVEFHAGPRCTGGVTFAGADSRTFEDAVAVRSVRVDTTEE
ncbi:hypothetical protein ACFV3R_03700 [Streptomyces sp. NPDC059740]|uniref:hypothetical protein n=1 Tax=Streptomyces sp. NPDC059740 TaxID=3346926 RepID=UPI003663A587